VFEFNAQTGRIDCNWNTAVPTGKLLQKLWPSYCAARDHFLSSIDLLIAVVEL
jgi:hypothetical protein